MFDNAAPSIKHGSIPVEVALNTVYHGSA